MERYSLVYFEGVDEINSTIVGSIDPKEIETAIKDERVKGVFICRD